MTHPVIWTSTTEYYDEEDGIQITKHKAKTEYIIIKKNKHATFNYNKTKGHITNTVQCRKQPQLTIWGTDTQGENKRNTV